MIRPALWPTLITVPSLIVLLALGTWQVQRLHWKEGLIAARQSALAAAPVPLPATLDDPAAFAFRRVTVRGRFRHRDEIHLIATSLEGEGGYQVVTPLERADGGGIVLVNRGWVPYERKHPESRAEGQLAGEVTIEGIATLPGSKGFFVPDNDDDANVWFWRDLPGMARHLGLEVQPLFVEAGPAPNPGGYPRGGQSRVELRNDHLSYAITWYALAAALAAVYLIYHWRRGGAERA